MGQTTKASGNIAMLWGSKNAAIGNLAGTIIDSLELTPKNGEPIDIEDGDGMAAIQTLLNDGFNAKASCVYDSNKVYPAEGATVTLVGPNMAGIAGTQNYNCTFWSWSFRRGKRKETMIELSFTHRPNINT